MTTVLQIFLGPIPDALVAAVGAVRSFADRTGARYLVLGRPDWPGADWSPYALSNWMRAEYASRHPDVLYADWDIRLRPDFELPQTGAAWHDEANPDAFFYSRSTLTFWEYVFRDLREYHERVPTAKYERSRLWKILNKYRKPMSFFEDGYEHLHYHAIGGRNG